MILHIPHSSTHIPVEFKEQFLLSDKELQTEHHAMTDAYTDELFSYEMATSIIFPYSRLLVDVERFPNDKDEPMSKKGMGMIYTKTSDGKALKSNIMPEIRERLLEYYKSHHRRLTEVVDKELNKLGESLIIDCHSFPSQPKKCDINQDTPRPDICIGTDYYHTSTKLIDHAENTLKEMGYNVGINWPFSGSLVPMKHYNKDNRVQSIMIEVNRNLYMSDTTGLKKDSFNMIKSQLDELMAVLDKQLQ